MQYANIIELTNESNNRKRERTERELGPWVGYELKEWKCYNIIF